MGAGWQIGGGAVGLKELKKAGGGAEQQVGVGIPDWREVQLVREVGQQIKGGAVALKEEKQVGEVGEGATSWRWGHWITRGQQNVSRSTGWEWGKSWGWGNS